MYKINNKILMCLSFNLREKRHQTVIHLYDCCHNFTTVLEMTCLKCSTKSVFCLSYHNIRSYKLHNFMFDRSIACLPVFVCGCPDGCGAGNKTSANNKS